MFGKYEREMKEIGGDLSVYFKNLTTGEEYAYQAEQMLVAASVIKLPMLIEAFRQFETGELSPEQTICVSPAVKVPSCGALTYLHDGLEITLLDAATLMIILSDNTATNLLFDILGCENVNQTLCANNCNVITLRRKMFDSAASAKGIQNTITAREIGRLLERMYNRTLLLPSSCGKMLSILGNQRLNGKIPFYLHSQGILVAHKTGEDDGVTHDCGIIFTKQPFILCCCSNNTDVPAFELLMQRMARDLAAACGGKP